jgi:hypothetical protein
VPAPRKSSRGWLYAGIAALLILILGGVIANKRKQAALSAQTSTASGNLETAPPPSQPPSPTPTIPSTEESKKQPLNSSGASRRETTPKVEVPAKKSPPPVETQPDISGFALQLQVYALAPANVEIQPDDRPSATHLMKAGHKVSAGAEKAFLVRTDNAGALRLNLNGQDLAELGPLGAPRTVRLTARDLNRSAGGNSPERSTGTTPPPPGKGTGGKGPGRPAQASVQIDIPRMAGAVDLLVWMDDQILYEHDRTPNRGVSAVTQQKSVPAGKHSFRVFLGNKGNQKGIEKTTAGGFAAGQSRVLRIEVFYGGPRREVAQIRMNVSLE